MASQFRVQRINQLLDEMNPIHQQLIRLKAQRHILKENFFKSYDLSKKNKFEKIEKEIEEAESQLTPLFTELRTLQNRYLVQYEGEVRNMDGTKYSQTQVEELYLQTECRLDTFSNGWEIYDDNPNMLSVQDEILRFLYLHRFTSFVLLNVKSF